MFGFVKKLFGKDEPGSRLPKYKGGDFDAQIAQGEYLVDFWATWCAPCQQQAKLLEQYIVPEANGLKILKVDVEKWPELAARFGVNSIPALFIFKDGKQIASFRGLTRPAEILAALGR